MAISVPDGHMAGTLAKVAHDPDEARTFVRQIAADKPDLIKLMITGGVMDGDEAGEPDGSGKCPHADGGRQSSHDHSGK